MLVCIICGCVSGFIYELAMIPMMRTKTFQTSKRQRQVAVTHAGEWAQQRQAAVHTPASVRNHLSHFVETLGGGAYNDLKSRHFRLSCSVYKSKDRHFKESIPCPSSESRNMISKGFLYPDYAC